MIKTFEGCNFFFGERISPEELDFMMQQMWQCMGVRESGMRGVSGSAQLLTLKFQRDESRRAFRLDFTFSIEVAG